MSAFVLARDTVKDVGDFVVVKERTHRSGSRSTTRRMCCADEVSVSLLLTLRACNIELTTHGIRRCEFATDAKFFFEPFHRLGTLHRPEEAYRSRDRLAVSHAFDEIEELRDDGRDARSSCDEDYVLE